jgi:hypothetical protein
MKDDEITGGSGNVVLKMQRAGHSLYEIKQPVTAGRNMRAVLDVVRGPEALRSGIVAFVEERVEGFENERLVLLRGCLDMISSPAYDSGSSIYLGP